MVQSRYDDFGRFVDNSEAIFGRPLRIASRVGPDKSSYRNVAFWRTAGYGPSPFFLRIIEGTPAFWKSFVYEKQFRNLETRLSRESISALLKSSGLAMIWAPKEPRTALPNPALGGPLWDQKAS